jgi:hypothetical protein
MLLALSWLATAGAPSGAKCRLPECPFIYVYDSAPVTQLLVRQLDAGFDEKINSDMLLHKALLDSGCVVAEPERAAFFFVPFYSSSRYRSSISAAEAGKMPAFCELLRHMQSDWRDSVYWKRRAQHDHALAITRIAEWYRMERLLAATSTRLLLHSIEIMPMRLNGTVALPYPIHMPASKHAPYVDPRARPNSPSPMGLAFFAGSSVLNLRSGNRSTLMRTALKAAMDERKADCMFVETGRMGGTTHNVVNRVWKDRDAANKIIELSTGYWFCPVPPGDSRSSARLYDSLWRLCIPVLFGNRWQLPFDWLIPWDRIVVELPEQTLASHRTASNALAQLAAMGVEERVRRRALMLEHRHLFDLHYRPKRSSGLTALIRKYAIRAQRACKHAQLEPERPRVAWERFAEYCSTSRPR